MPIDKIIFTISYGLVIIGSIGMIKFASKFPFSTHIADLKLAKERLFGLDGYQVWVCSWAAILIGTFGQLVATWLVGCR